MHGTCVQVNHSTLEQIFIKFLYKEPFKHININTPFLLLFDPPPILQSLDIFVANSVIIWAHSDYYGSSEGVVSKSTECLEQ